LRTRHRDRLKAVEHRSDGDEGHKRLIDLHDEIEFTLIESERQQINELYRGGKLKDEARRRIERELDLREAQLTNVRAEE
jgi:CPA1 family monovalent cation:H+ antiporter